MGRNAVKKASEGQGPAQRAGDESDKPMLRGGALGVVDNRAEVRISGLPNNLVGSAVRAEREPVPPAREFRVKYAPPQGVMYDNFRVQMRVGKVVTDQTYNLGLLTRQGVILEEIPPPPKVEESPVVKARGRASRAVDAELRTGKSVDGVLQIEEGGDEDPEPPADGAPGPTAAE